MWKFIRNYLKNAPNIQTINNWPWPANESTINNLLLLYRNILYFGDACAFILNDIIDRHWCDRLIFDRNSLCSMLIGIRDTHWNYIKSNLNDKIQSKCNSTLGKVRGVWKYNPIGGFKWNLNKFSTNALNSNYIFGQGLKWQKFTVSHFKSELSAFHQLR